MTCRQLQIQNEKDWAAASRWLAARTAPDASVETAVREIIAAVRERGDAALVDYTRKFDAPEFTLPVRVSPQEIARAAASVPVENREYI